MTLRSLLVPLGQGPRPDPSGARRGAMAKRFELQTPDTPIAPAMLACATEFDADLLVMGAYGHARWTERVLGRATQGVLERMRLPVLLAH